MTDTLTHKHIIVYYVDVAQQEEVIVCGYYGMVVELLFCTQLGIGCC